MSGQESNAHLLVEVQALHRRVAELERAVEERTRTLEALAQSQECFRLLVDHASDLIWIGAADGTPLYVNRAVTRLTGYTLEEAMAVPLEKQLTPASYAAVMGAITQELARSSAAGELPRQLTFETEIIRKDGSTFLAEACITLLLNSDGTPRMAVGVTRDISERKRIEEQLLRAERLQTISRLAGGVAHDFNNLLTAIIGHASFARDALPPQEPARQDVEQVLQTAHRAGALIRKLLAFARRQPVAPLPTDLNGLVLEMEALLRHLLGDDIELVFLPAADLGAARADPHQIEQVLVNLADNARDAMPGGGRLTIETANVTISAQDACGHPALKPGRFVLLSVRDSGAGMTDEVKAHLFEPFFTTKEPREGTGLGLSMVFGIVGEHQGGITVESAPGQGTTFRIYLPRVEEPPAQVALDEGTALP